MAAPPLKRVLNKWDYMSKRELKNISELSSKQKRFIDGIPYLTLYDYNDSTYYKLTGYHVGNKDLKDCVPPGYKVKGLVQLWSEIKYTTINILRLERV